MRQSSQQAHARSLELNLEHAQQRREQRATSKKNNDEYYLGLEKSAFKTGEQPEPPAKIRRRATSSPFDPVVVTSATCMGLDRRPSLCSAKAPRPDADEDKREVCSATWRLQSFLAAKEMQPLNAAAEAINPLTQSHLLEAAPAPLVVHKAEPTTPTTAVASQKRHGQSPKSSMMTKKKMTEKPTSVSGQKRHGQPSKSSKAANSATTAKRRRLAEEAVLSPSTAADAVGAGLPRR